MRTYVDILDLEASAIHSKLHVTDVLQIVVLLMGNSQAVSCLPNCFYVLDYKSPIWQNLFK